MKNCILVLHNASEVVEQNSRSSWRVYNCHQNVTKSSQHLVKNSGAFGNISCTPQTILVHLEPEAILSGSDLYNMYSKEYNLTNYDTPTSVHLELSSLVHILYTRYQNPDDDVCAIGMARWHASCPWLCNTYCVHSHLARSVWSLAIILP